MKRKALANPPTNIIHADTPGMAPLKINPAQEAGADMSSAIIMVPKRNVCLACGSKLLVNLIKRSSICRILRKLDLTVGLAS